jgi:3-oxoacyl-[acyl-carrier protein] reductase
LTVIVCANDNPSFSPNSHQPRALAMNASHDPANIAAGCHYIANIGETGLLEEFMGMPDTPENRKKFLVTILLGRMSRPADVANATLYLASDEAEFFSGVCLEVDGARCV